MARQWIAPRRIQCDELALGDLRHREVGDECRERAGIHAIRRNIVRDHAHRVAGDQPVRAEVFALEQHSAREAEPRIERAVECGLEAIEVDAERAREAERVAAVERMRRLHRLAAAVGDEQAPVDQELVALRVAAEIVVGLEQQDACVRFLAPIEPRRREAADARAHDDQVVALIDGDAIGREAPPVAQRVGDVEAAGRRAPQAAAGRRVGCIPVRCRRLRLQQVDR